MLDFLLSTKGIAIFFPLSILIALCAAFGDTLAGKIASDTFSKGKKDKKKATRVELAEVIPTAEEYEESSVSQFASTKLAPSTQWLQKHVDKTKLDNTIELITQAGNPFNVSSIKDHYSYKVLFTLVLGAVGLVAGLIVGYAPIGLAIGGLLGWFVVDFVLKTSKASRADELLNVLPEALDLLAVITRAGLTFEAAFAQMAARIPDSLLAKDLRKTATFIQSGQSVSASLDWLNSQYDSRELYTFCSSIKRGLESGNDPSDILQKNAELVRNSYIAKVRGVVGKLDMKFMLAATLFILPAFFIAIVYPSLGNMNGGGLSMLGGM